MTRWLTLTLLIAAGCYDPQKVECTVKCAADGRCPGDTTCGADGYCHQTGAPQCLPQSDGPLADGGMDDGPTGDLKPLIDNRAPTFAGARMAMAASSTTITVSWDAGSDDITPPEQLLYYIYVSLTPGGEDYATPRFITPAGATSHTLTGLTPATTYYVVVRVRDLAGNSDSNTVEVSARTNVL